MGRKKAKHRRDFYQRIGEAVFTYYRECAMREVKKAVAAKRLASVLEFTCVDCDKQAWGYDHRSYDEPLTIAPTCIGCNFKRGIGKLSIERILKDLRPYRDYGGDVEAGLLTVRVMPPNWSERDK